MHTSILGRRQFLGQMALAGAWSVAPGLGLAAVPQAGDRRLVLVILRGALDGLAAVQPWGDPALVQHREQLLVPSEQLLKLDSFFGLHPAFANLYDLYQKQQAEIFHAIATPYRERSHFDGQNVLETGLEVPQASAPGWLNQTAGLLGPQGLVPSAIALSTTVPRVLMGTAPVASWSPDNLPKVADPVLEKLSLLYALDSFLGPRMQQALQADLLATGGSMETASTTDAAGLAGLASAAARFLAQSNGPAIAVLETGHVWDTHINQGGAQGTLAQQMSGLDAALAVLAQQMGSYWATTQVLVVTEFGRTVAVNGSGGTDHGTATVAFRLGGAVAGGQVRADWPGLATSQLLDGRDLRPTADLRLLFDAAALHLLAG